MALSPLLAALEERVLIWDGAMGTQIQAANLTSEDFTLTAAPHFSAKVSEAATRLDGKPLDGCNELLVLTRPELVRDIHAAYLDAGADLIETNTFGSTSIVLAEYGIEELVYEISLQAAKVARAAADERGSSSKPRFVVGAVGPGTKLVSLGQTSWAELEDTYADSFRGLLEGGADALLLETLQDLLMVKACIVAAERAMADTGRPVPLIVQVTMEQTGTMLLGSEIAAALNMVEAFPSVTAFGLNCATGPVEMTTHIRFLGQKSTRPISIQPNAGLPVLENGQAKYRLTPEELASHHERFVEEHGVALCGGCCGTTPSHIRAVANAVGGRAHTDVSHWRKVRNLFPGFDFRISDPSRAEAFALVGCSSLYQFQPYEQDSSFLIVGERTNANGSRAFRDLLAREDWEGLTELARDLEAEGSHVLDVCTAYVGRDEIRDMVALLSRYNRHVTVPLMIDSTEWQVTEKALQTVAGKPILNSINFEDGENRVNRVLGLARKYGAAVVALTIDEDGMAKTIEKKLAIAERLIDRTRAAGLADHDLFIDCLTFTLGSGDEEFRGAGFATIDAIRAVRTRFPRVNTILGVSNISFGLKPTARQVLNSVFLHYCREAGLTAAIVDIAKIRPENQIEPAIWQIASDLVFDRRRYSAA
jgi:5-methyltetrahydrofolate--homocysteine methyltransferase